MNRYDGDRRNNIEMSPSGLTSRKRVLAVNFIFFSFFPSIVGFGVLIYAVALVGWRVEIPLGSTSNDAIMYGLFQVCTISSMQGANTDRCVTSQEFAQSGGILSTENNDLEQATKGMAIVSIFFALISSIVSLILGLRKYYRSRGFLVSAGVHFFTGACIMSGAITYTLLLDNLQEIIPSGTFLFAHLSYHLMWVAMGLSFLSCILSLIAGFIKRD